MHIILFSLFFFFLFKYQSKAQQPDQWTGTISLNKKMTGITGKYERQVKIIFTDSKGKGTVQENGEGIIGSEVVSKITCTGSGDAELHEVSFDPKNRTYRIHAISPPYTCIATGKFGTETTVMHELDLIVSDRPLDNNPNVLIGTETRVNDMVGAGTVTTSITWNLKKACPPWKDPYTEKKINTLDARVKGLASRFIKRVYDELCIKLRVAQGLRTAAEQDYLYAQGRTRPGSIVTNTKGGTSNHNLGLAIDVYNVKDDRTIDLYGVVPPEVVEIARQGGFEWGGNWKKFRDYPHFEMKF